METNRTQAGRGVRRLTLLSLTVAAAILPATVAASHLFGDVPTSNSFHSAIAAIEGAGITVGCGGGNFCPNAAITRAQEAAFVTRGLPRIAQSDELLDNSVTGAESWTVVGRVTIEVPGVVGEQFVVVDGMTSTIGTNMGDETYPNARIHSSDGAYSRTFYYKAEPAGFHQDEIAVRWVFAAASGVHTYDLEIALVTVGAGTLYFPHVSMTAMTVPFGASGGTELTPAGEVGSVAPAGLVNGGR